MADNGDTNDVHGIVVDEVLNTQQLDEDDLFALVVRSGEGFAALVFDSTKAREAAELLTAAADEVVDE